MSEPAGTPQSCTFRDSAAEWQIRTGGKSDVPSVLALWQEAENLPLGAVRLTAIVANDEGRDVALAVHGLHAAGG